MRGLIDVCILYRKFRYATHTVTHNITPAAFLKQNPSASLVPFFNPSPCGDFPLKEGRVIYSLAISAYADLGNILPPQVFIILSSLSQQYHQLSIDHKFRIATTIGANNINPRA